MCILLYAAFCQIWQGDCSVFLFFLKMMVTCKTLGGRNRAEENFMQQISKISCDPHQQRYQYYQLWLVVRWFSIGYLSQNLTHKFAKMCNTNTCHLTPQSQVWIPVSCGSDLWVSHLSVSSISDHWKSLLAGRKTFTSVEKKPKLVSAASQEDGPLSM